MKQYYENAKNSRDFYFNRIDIDGHHCGNPAEYLFIYYPGMNDMGAGSKVLNLISNQVISFRNEKRYATSEELEIDKRQVPGYKIEMTSDGKSFQIWATPVEYGRNGKMSFYADSNDGDVHGADHRGGKANANDPVVKKIFDEAKEILRKNREQN